MPPLLVTPSPPHSGSALTHVSYHDLGAAVVSVAQEWEIDPIDLVNPH